jgi:hypothetical protein
MDAKATAPTITINGVTSNPGEPVTMTSFTCGCFPILTGHDAEAGDTVECDECNCYTTVLTVFKTWVF